MMRAVVILSPMVVVLAAALAASDDFRDVVMVPGSFQKISCPRGWISSPDGCIKFETLKNVTWNTASGRCMDMGGTLATFHDWHQIYWLRGYIAYHPNLHDLFFWIGGYKSNGVWFWKGRVTDTPMSVTNWMIGEPNNQGANENCLSLKQAGANNRWNDARCTSAYSFICQKDQF